MAEKIKTVIVYRQILSSKHTVHRQRLKYIDRHMKTTGEIRRKAQKKRWLFTAMALVVIQSFREKSLWMRPSNQAWLDMENTLFGKRQWYENFQVPRLVSIHFERDWGRHNDYFARSKERYCMDIPAIFPWPRMTTLFHDSSLVSFLLQRWPFFVKGTHSLWSVRL